MSTKQYRPWNLDQQFLLPPSLREWVPKEHLVWFVIELVEQLDISAIEAKLHDKDPRGTRPYSPRMMTALLLYAYCVGIYSSRKIECATYEDVAVRVLTAGNHPVYWTIAAFRRNNAEELKSLFVQCLKLCNRMGLLKLGLVALDGTKVKAAASKHKAMSYDRMKTDEKRLEEELAELRAKAEELLGEAERTDQVDDVRFGDARGDELPEELHRRESRLERIQEAKAALEEEARRARIAKLRAQARSHETNAADEQRDDKTRRLSATLQAKRTEAARALHSDDDEDEPPPAAPTDMPSHQVPHDKDGTPKPKAQRNFTDPDSRIMVSGDGAFVQAYNAQALTEASHQIIVATGLGNQAPDAEYLAPMLHRAAANCASLDATREQLDKVLTDSGYWSVDGAATAEELGLDLYCAIGRRRLGSRAPPGDPPPEDAAPHEKMKHKVASDPNDICRHRKTIAEPPFGQIKEARGFRRFSMRGIEKAAFEWDWICTAHNVLKMWRSAVPLPA